MSCGYNCENNCLECDYPDLVIEYVKGYNQALEDLERRYIELVEAEYGNFAYKDGLVSRAIRSLKK